MGACCEFGLGGWGALAMRGARKERPTASLLVAFRCPLLPLRKALTDISGTPQGGSLRRCARPTTYHVSSMHCSRCTSGSRLEKRSSMPV